MGIYPTTNAVVYALQWPHYGTSVAVAGILPGDFGAGWASTAFDRQSVVGIFAQVSRRLLSVSWRT